MDIRFDVTEDGVAESAELSPESGGYRIKYKVRNILRDHDTFCLVHSGKEGYYTLPGGSMDADEDPVQAVLRETLEETGAVVTGLEKVGETRELRREQGRLQITYYFESEVERLGEPSLTEEEIALDTTIVWVSRDECERLLNSQESPLYFRRFSGLRDREMFRRYAGSI